MIAAVEFGNMGVELDLIPIRLPVGRLARRRPDISCLVIVQIYPEAIAIQSGIRKEPGQGIVPPTESPTSAG